MPNIAVIVGTRPNFIKHYAFQRACLQKNVPFVTIHTGQHFDQAMSDDLFKELDLAAPEYSHVLNRTNLETDLDRQVTFIEHALSMENPDVTVVYGDVTSSMAGAIASDRLSIPVAHIEAGVHTESLDNPEEKNRRFVEKTAHTLFPHTRHAQHTLLAAGYPEESVFLVGDIMKDTLLGISERHNIFGEKGDYLLVTVHRAENTDSGTRLGAICEALIECERSIIFPVHPRTRAALLRTGYWQRLKKCPSITLLPPQGYVKSLRLIAGADKVISESGGRRREAYVLGKPVISLIELNWVPEMVDAGWEWIAGADKKKINEGIVTFNPPPQQDDTFGDGKASNRIVSILSNRYGLTGGQNHPIVSKRLLAGMGVQAPSN